jgi:IMP dehydrogenase
MLNLKEGLTFDDVLLRPKYSTIKSRSDVDLSVQISKTGFSTTLAHPIIPANMKTIMNYDMAQAVFQCGGLGLLHRFMPADEQLAILTRLDELFGRMIWCHLGLSVGIQDTDKEHIKKFVDNGVEILCIDVAHGHSQRCLEMTQWIAEQYPEVLLIAGNMATGEGARSLWNAGADLVKVGVGSGSLCTTRVQTGAGVPQFTALLEVSQERQQLLDLMRARPTNQRRSFGIIADGGCKNPGDVLKSLCLADLVMTGNLFAGCMETPGNPIVIDDVEYKEYVGSSTHKANHIEGVAALVPQKRSFGEELIKILEGLRSGCSYQGAHDLAELKDNPSFIRITHAGLMESYPHDVIVRGT